MKLNTVVVERWETVVKNITEIQVRNENDEVLAKDLIFSEDVESIDGDDKYIFSVDEFIERFPNMTEEIKKQEEDILLLFNRPETPNTTNNGTE